VPFWLPQFARIFYLMHCPKFWRNFWFFLSAVDASLGYKTLRDSQELKVQFSWRQIAKLWSSTWGKMLLPNRNALSEFVELFPTTRYRYFIVQQ
jgi:hypothetical protein